MEIWKDIPKYEGLYQVSNLGNVKSLPKKHQTKTIILKPTCDGNGKGYLFVNLGRKGRIKIHRAVAMAFIPNPDNLPEVNHKDGNTKNNNINNLEWVTHQQNCEHYTYKLGQHKKQFKMKPIYMLNNNKKIICEFRSIAKAVKWLKENTIYKKALSTNISAACNGKYKSAYGYKWKYKEVF